MALRTQMRSLRLVRDLLFSQKTEGLLPYRPDPKPDPDGQRPAFVLERAAPEEEGADCGALAELYRALADAPQADVHALLLARHGRVVSEGWFAPYRPGVRHVTHSLCKSFTGTAVGLAIAEGYFGLEDKVAGYFPEYCSLFTGRRARAITVRHLLTMSSGISFNEMGEALESDWLRGIFESEILFEPGSRFLYNSMNSYLLSALVKRTTGQGLVEFLTPRVFAPLGFGTVGWEKCPHGIEKGGWGMYLDPEDMLKFGQLYLQGGVWQTDQGPRRLLPEEWVREATRTQITGSEGEYGYHIWTNAADGSFLMNGMFGQYVAIFPRQQAVAVMLSGNGNLFADSVAYTCLREGVARSCAADRPLPARRREKAALERLLGALEFGRPAPEQIGWTGRLAGRLAALLTRRQAEAERAAERAAIDALCGRRWTFPRSRAGLLPMMAQVMDGNFSGGVRALRLHRQGERLLLEWEEPEGALELPVGLGGWADGEIRIGPERFLTAARGDLRRDEDGRPVLVILLCLPEHSSCRQIKLSLQPGGAGQLQLRLDERPSLVIGIKKMFEQDQNTGTRNPLAELISGGYTQYRLRQLIAPELEGTPDAADAPEDAARAPGGQTGGEQDNSEEEEGI